MLLNKKIATETVRRKERFLYDPLADDSIFKDNIDYILTKIRENLSQFTYKYPSAASENLVFRAENNETSEWTAGFWTGMLWLAYETGGDECYRNVAEIQMDDYIKRLNERIILDHHDIGFLYILSCVASYKITGNKTHRDVALKAADLLASRYLEKAKIIQVRDRSKDEKGTFIIDCCMNIPLLYWAAKETENDEYFQKAYNHIQQVAQYMVREDASTYHCFRIDPDSGKPLKGWQGQGYSDESCWARGQAWGIYGFALSYLYTGDKDCLDISQKLANYFLNRLPNDIICNWDLDFLNDDVQRDSSASAIAACGMLQLSDMLPDDSEDKVFYKNAAAAILKVLCKSYTTKNHKKSNGILMHGVYCKGGPGDDECCIWGDYFFFEGLIRLINGWRCYW